MKLTTKKIILFALIFVAMISLFVLYYFNDLNKIINPDRLEFNLKSRNVTESLSDIYKNIDSKWKLSGNVVLASGGITIDDNKNIENCIITLCDLDYEYGYQINFTFDSEDNGMTVVVYRDKGNQNIFADFMPWDKCVELCTTILNSDFLNESCDQWYFEFGSVAMIPSEINYGSSYIIKNGQLEGITDWNTLQDPYYYLTCWGLFRKSDGSWISREGTFSKVYLGK